MKNAIVIFSFNRPDILLKSLNSIRIQNNISKYDIFLYQDNYFNEFSKKSYCEASLIEKSIDVFKSIFPEGKVVLQNKNVGVGLNHFNGYEDIFIKHKYDIGIFFDDDVILGNDQCIDTLIEMNKMTKDNSNVMGSELYTIPFKYNANDKILLLDTFKYHVDYKGFCCSLTNFIKIYEFYKKNVESFFSGIDYRDRWWVRDRTGITYQNKIKKFFEKEGKANNKFYSQDWVRDTCFRHFGMSKKAIFCANISKNIGEEGVHSNSKEFLLEGFDNISLYDGKIVLNDIINIEQDGIIISNNPAKNQFALAYKNEANRLYLNKKYGFRF